MRSLKLVIDNGDKNIENMSPEELSEAQRLANGMSFVDRGAFYKMLLRPAVLAYQGDVIKPDWLKSDFKAPVWQCQFGGKRKKLIDFNIHLNDGKLLTAPMHQRFLYQLKYWLCAQTHPRYCGGKKLKGGTVYTKILTALQLLDGLILRSEHFKIDKFGLSLVTENDIFTLMWRLNSYGLYEGLYQYITLVNSFLKQKIVFVTTAEVVAAKKRYPNIDYIPVERTLSLTDDELVKARVWLLNKSAYGRPNSSGDGGNCSSGIFVDSFYVNSLHGKSLNPPAFNELRIVSREDITEYRAVPVTNKQDKGQSIRSIVPYIASLKSLGIGSCEEQGWLNSEALVNLNLKSLEPMLTFKAEGRFLSVPAQEVFNVMRHASEFVLDYCDEILQVVGDVVLGTNAQLDTEIGKIATLNILVNRAVTPKLKQLGVSVWYILSSDNRSRPKEYYDQIRAGIGLSELYDVLMGSIQIIIGAMMARRSSELYELDANCLIPNTDPTLSENKKTNYLLVFDNRKSGDDTEREELGRPITQLGATLIWKLRSFRERLISGGGLDNRSRLLLSLKARSAQCIPISVNAYNSHLNSFCDYFETSVIPWSDGKPRRYYLRQHQLRRFFAMAFFWGVGSDILETLRYFLGHTDAENLWHYITENTPGTVLRGVKAERLIYGLDTDAIEGIESLRVLLKDRLDVDDVVLDQLNNRLKELEDDVSDGFIEVTPHIDKLRQQVEADIDQLLCDGIIDLQPEFCILHNKNGEVVQELHLILLIKELNYDS